MSFNKSLSFNCCISLRSTAKQRSCIIIFKHFSPYCFLTIRCCWNWLHKYGSWTKCVKHFIRKPSYYCRVWTIEFSPTLLQNHHPNLIPSSRIGKEDLSILVHWKIIINHNLKILPIMQHSSHVNSMGIYFQRREQILNPVILLSQCRKSGKKIAISKLALQNVTWLNFIFHKNRILNDFWHSLPS